LPLRPYLVGYVRWDARSNQVHLLLDNRFQQLQLYSSQKSVNKVILLGSVGHDPEVKFTASGIPVGRFSLATNERFKDNSGKFQERTEWHNIVVWRRLAEIVGEFVSKGSQLYIEGKLQTTSWEDRQGTGKKYRTEVVADNLVLVGSREKGNGAQPTGPRKADNAKPIAPAVGAPGISDDELPF
jgi:single-strand DNA-binding protein